MTTDKAVRHVLLDAEYSCELRYFGCEWQASTTSAGLATDHVSSHRAACRHCADARRVARGW